MNKVFNIIRRLINFVLKLFRYNTIDDYCFIALLLYSCIIIFIHYEYTNALLHYMIGKIYGLVDKKNAIVFYVIQISFL